MAKQVIVMRKDLNMRKGKMIAQGAHASLGAVLSVSHYGIDPTLEIDLIQIPLRGAVKEWLEGKFTKICVSVDSEEELTTIYNNAKAAGLPSVLITDAGLTEFNGVPTITCCGIGPADELEIDVITGHLKLL